MRVTCLGHAALYIETEDQRILVDPVDLDRLPDPTAIFITCSDSRHFHPPTLQRFQKELPVFHPEDRELRQELEGLGFSRLSTCRPGQKIELGQTRLIPTPSTAQERKLDIAICLADGSLFVPAITGPVPDDIVFLKGQGESTAVLQKKVLLSILAESEAVRLGMPIAESDVASLTDWFRRRFGLEDSDKMKRWLDEVGLDMDSFTRVMSGFAAVAQVQGHRSAEIESLLGNYAKVASIRNAEQ